MQLWSAETPLREPARRAGLSIKHLHVKGEPVTLKNGKVKASVASRHYVSSDNVDVDDPNEANKCINVLFVKLGGTQLAKLIATNIVDAEICLAAFHGDVDWEAGLDPELIATAHAANVKLMVVHYDKLTDEGVPLAVTV